MRAAFDARMALGNYRGMGYYARALAHSYPGEMLALSATGEEDSALHPLALGYRFFPAWEQMSLPRRVQEKDIDLLVCPYNTAPLHLPRRVRLILVVHDLIFLQPASVVPPARSLYQKAGRYYRRLITPHAVHRADSIIAVSHHTENALLHRLHCDPAKITVIPNTIEPSWFQTISAPGRVNAPAPYVLCVSGEAPSKNLLRALDAFALFNKTYSGPSQYRFLIAGVSDDYHLHYSGVAHDKGVAVEMLGYIPMHSLQQMYRDASLVLVPSLLEGFGRPLLEAMASGTPVVSSDAGSLTEVGGEAALYCNARDPQTMAGAMAKVLSDPALQRQMCERGFVQSSLYHPDRIGELMTSFWRRELSAP